MDDVDGSDVTTTLYRRLFSVREDESDPGDAVLDPDVVPFALDEAVRALRAKGVSPSRWATYIHIGV